MIQNLDSLISSTIQNKELCWLDIGPLRVPLDLALRQIFNYLYNAHPARFGVLNTAAKLRGLLYCVPNLALKAG